MNPSLAEEWPEIEALHPDARQLGEPERVELALQVSPALYGTESLRVAVLIPPGYRATGPDGFLVPNGTALASGSQIPASDGAGLGMPEWMLVSFHHVDERGESTWRATNDPNRGDNFLGYIGSIESFLQRGCN